MIQLQIFMFVLLIFHIYLSFCCCHELIGPSGKDVILDESSIVADNRLDDQPDDSIVSYNIPLPVDLNVLRDRSNWIGRTQSLSRDKAWIRRRSNKTNRSDGGDHDHHHVHHQKHQKKNHKQFESRDQSARREQEISTIFTLVNTITDKPIGLLINNSVIDLQNVGKQLSIIATPINTTNGKILPVSSISKVVFILDNVKQIEEKSAPYLLAGNNGNNYRSSASLTNPLKFNIQRNITVLVYSVKEPLKIFSQATTIFQIVGSGVNNPVVSMPASAPVVSMPISAPVVSMPVSAPIASIPVPAPVMVMPATTPVVSMPIASAPVVVTMPASEPIVPMPSPTDVNAYNHNLNGAITGELLLWHKITIGYDGPMTSESAVPNPFTDYRLDVTLTNDVTKERFIVPGYYAADGNAANTGATAGNVWLVHFIPNSIGLWSWTASFMFGTNVVLNGNNGVSAGYFDKMNGTFIINETNKIGRDLRSKGLLQYVNEHYLRFAGSGQYFVKTGADSPENFLAYADFDNTPNNGNRRKTWGPHEQDYIPISGTTWMNGKGKGIIGAINYLSNQGMNAMSMLTMNINGDDKNVFPYVTTNDFQRIDASKTAQWEIVFEHADRMGMFLHFKTQETENDQLLDGGALGMNRTLYYRELIARFGHHLALNWNLGEETTNTNLELKSYCDYFKANDPYDHLIVVHTYPGQQRSIYTPLLGYTNFTGVSLQTSPTDVAAETSKWIKSSALAGHKWIVSSDEIGGAGDGVVPDANDFTHDTVRKYVLWGNLMNHGGGVEYYFGYNYPNSDLTCQDYRSRANMWKLSNIALNFFNGFSIPFWLMQNNADEILLSTTSINYCMATNDLSIIIMYLVNGGSEMINLASIPSTTSYSIQWYDTRNGGMLQVGTESTVMGGTMRSIGFAPIETSNDWAVLIKKK